jgi:hypothetical protein
MYWLLVILSLAASRLIIAFISGRICGDYECRQRYLPHFFAKCGSSKATDTANEHLGSPRSKAKIFAG